MASDFRSVETGAPTFANLSQTPRDPSTCSVSHASNSAADEKQSRGRSGAGMHSSRIENVFSDAEQRQIVSLTVPAICPKRVLEVSVRLSLGHCVSLKRWPSFCGYGLSPGHDR